MRKILFFAAKWIVLPTILIIQFFYVAFLFNPYEPFSIVTYPVTSRDAVSSTKAIGKPLYKGDKVVGKFTAPDNNLGIVLVRFWNFENISKDKLIFRIKEVGAKNWYYTGTYKVDQFQPNEYFTFGFPIIENSKAKSYQFELESTAGKKGDAIAISKQHPYFATRYKFFLTKNKTHPLHILGFSWKKIVDLLTDTRSALLSVIYLFPFVCFTFVFLIRSNAGVKVFYFALLVYMLSLSWFEQFTFLPGLAIVTVCMYWIFGLVRYKFDSSVNFAFAVFFLVITTIVASFSSISYATQNFGIFFYWMLLFGTGERLVEIKINKSYKTNWKGFVKLLIS